MPFFPQMPPMRDMKPRGSTGFIGSASGKSLGDLGLGGRCNTIESDLVPPRQAVASKPLPSPPRPSPPQQAVQMWSQNALWSCRKAGSALPVVHYKQDIKFD